MKTNKIMPPTWLLIAISVMIILHFLLPGGWVVPKVWNLTGLVFLTAGVMANLMADSAFHKAHTTVKPFEESTVLVTDGVFQLSRNPMYLGFVLILAGIAMLLRTISPYVVILAFVILIDTTYVRVEERILAEKFGAAWEAYQSRTRRWL
jgi:protein-S-isoprenylcysteine O-methyltransferase Ste14